MNQVSDCCVSGFKWGATPTGNPHGTLASNSSYITGTNPDAAILIIHDVFGWEFPNLRLLADHYASEVGATVYLPDFFGGEKMDHALLLKPREERKGWDVEGWKARNAKPIRAPEIFDAARALRAQYKRVGAIGFCYGGWGVFQLGAKGNDLVDCVSTGHPSWLEEKEIDALGVPVQILAPERDPQFTKELEAYCQRVIPGLGLAFDYQYFPGVEHGFAVRGDENNKEERRAMVRGKAAAVAWFKQWLHED